MVLLQRLLLLALLLLELKQASSLDIWITRGQLSRVKGSLEALMQLSRNLQQSTIWWQLTNVSWHPEAFWRFMVLGPPPPGVLPKDSWNSSQQDADLLKRGALAATKEAAVAQFETEVSRAGTGKIKVTAWALMYNCLNQDCDISAPVILTSSPSSSGKLNYGTLWQKVYSESSSSSSSSYVNPILLSASTADIYNKTFLAARKEGQTTMLRTVSKNVSQCEVALAFGRTPVGAAYKVMPGLCYHTMPVLKEKLNQSYIFAALEDMPHNFKWPYVRAHLENCKDAPVLIKKLETFKACVFSPEQAVYICTNFTVPDYDGTNCAGNQNKVNIAVSNFMLVYGYVRNPKSSANLTDEFQVVNDTVSGAPCNTAGVAKLAKYNASHNVFSLSHSIWEDTDGSNTDEFSYGKSSDSFCYYGVKFTEEDSGAYLRRCYVSTTLNTTVSRCDVTAVDGDLLDVMFNDSVTAYADEHNIAFNVDKGPPTDVFTAWAALVTAAVSVITATIPCTNIELEYLARFVFPKKKHENLKLLKFSIVALLNVVFGMILYAPIFAMILSESNRTETYYTWTVFTNDVKVNTFGTQMRTVLIIEGESLYRSRILLIFVVVCAITFPLIVFLTIKRSNKVFHRRKLLLEERFPNGVPSHLDHVTAKEINVKAIEMGLSEYVKLKSDLSKHTRSLSADIHTSTNNYLEASSA